MVDVDLVSHLIGDIYDAALDSALWTDVLEQTCQFVGGTAASLYSKEVVARQGAARYNWNMPADALTAYFNSGVFNHPSPALFRPAGSCRWVRADRRGVRR